MMTYILATCRSNSQLVHPYYTTPLASMRTMSVRLEMQAQYTHAERTGDLAPGRLARHKIGKPLVKAYFGHFSTAAPEEDQDD